MQLNFIKHLLRGLGTSELPIIFTTTFKKFFTTPCYTQKRFKSSEIAKKSVKIKYS